MEKIEFPLEIKSQLSSVTMSSDNRNPEANLMKDMESSIKPGCRKVSHKEQESELQKLNDLLSSEGIKLRKLMSRVVKVPELNKAQFIQNCIKWMTVCCNADDYYDCSMALQNLKILIKQSAPYSELNGSVSHFLKTKFFTMFFKKFLSLREGWECVELCLIHYKGACNAYHDRLKEAIVSQFEKKIVPKAAAKVCALLPMIGESGNDGASYTNKWKNQFEDMLKECNSILHNLFKDIVESQTYEDTLMDENYCKAEIVDEQLLYILFCNYCNVLRFMLLCSFPAPKSILPQKVFNIICRCINVTCNTLGSLDTTKKIKLSERLPQFHIITNSLMKALILTCKTHLLPYSFLISKLVYQTIQSTDAYLSKEWNEICLLLRISVYDTWIKWATVSNGAGTVQSNNIALSALHDLTVPSLREKTEAASADNAREDNDDANNTVTNHPLLKTLSIIAINVLQVYIREMGATLKADQLKAIQMYVIDNILKFQRCSSPEFPYSSSKCRYELYSLLMELVNCQSYVWGSPVNWAVEIFKRGIYDSNSEVVNYCSSALRNTQNIIDQEVIRVPSIENTIIQTD